MRETTSQPMNLGPQETVYQDHVRRIYRKVAEFEGFSKQYLVSDEGERAAVLVTSGSYVLFARQYRLLIDNVSLEIPGGRVDAGETPEKAAIRECYEETGVECRNLRGLQSYYPGLDVTFNPTYIFHSDDVVPTSVARNARSLWLPLYVCLEMISDGKIQDAMTIVALLTYSLDICRGVKIKNKPECGINPFFTHRRNRTVLKGE